MYVKLMVRGLLRHRKRGRRLFALMALCAAALVFLISFRNDFARQNRDQVIGLQTGHLQILPAESPILADSFTVQTREEVPLLELDDSFHSWLAMQEEIEGAAPVITRFTNSYNLDGEYETWLPLIALPASALAKVFPLATVAAGTNDITWAPFMNEVPVLRKKLDGLFGEKNPDTSRLERKNFSCTDGEFPEVMARVEKDFRAAYPGIFDATATDAEKREAVFFEAIAKLLADPAMPSKISPARFEAYDWRLDDAITAAEGNADQSLISFYNMRVLDALYSDVLYQVREPVRVGQRVSIQVAPFSSDGPITLPVVIPARYDGLVEFVPLYMAYGFIDINAFRTYMGLPEDAATSIVVRLKDIRDTEAMKRLIEEKLAAAGSDAKVVDWEFLGKMSLTTGTAMAVVITILIVVFVAIMLLFTVNLVMMSLVQRRREIGTGLAMGMSNAQTVLVMTGEVGVIVAVSTLAGSLIGLAATWAGARFGVPGMVFFPGSRLMMTVQWMPVLQAWLILLPSSLIVAFIPLSRILNLLPVELFKEDR